jgi:Skp family chaperone for outer membrane proteins
MHISKSTLAVLLAAPAMLAVAAPAQAQVAGIATANPIDIMTRAKAFTAADRALETANRPILSQMEARQTKYQADARPLLTTIDTNKDGDVSEAEAAAANTRKDPNLQKLVQLQGQFNEDIRRLQLPAVLAEAYAYEKILELYDAAQLRVVTARKISVILQPSAVLYGPDAVDVSDAILAEIDKTATVATTPPAGWQPQQRTIQFQTQINELKRRVAAIRQQQQAAQGAQQPGAAPAAGGARPATAPATGARPTTPPAPEPR